MNTDLTIARTIQLPEVSDYQWLREEILKYIEALGSRLWTDYNVHDPGITIADVLCYAITECGYKLGFSTADLLARVPGDNRKDFFTAREILSNNPTTILDLRKFVIDIPGIQNAWFYKHYYPFETGIVATCSNEYYTDPASGDLLVCKPAFYYECQQPSKAYDVQFDDPGGYLPKYINGLYNVVLQLEESEEFGDLNANVVAWEIEDGGTTFKLKIVFPVVEVAFPAWDYPIEQILSYNNLTSTSITSVSGSGDKRVIDKITFAFDGSASKKIEFTNVPVIIETKGALTNTKIRNSLEQMSATKPSFGIWYTRRLKTILALIRKVHCALHGVRNLCEDYVKYSIVRQQEILLCADIEVEPSADLETILAEIYFRVDNFLAPPVRFYNLLEMYEKGKRTEEIFNGYILNHGFMVDEELKLSDLKTEVHTSDLYHIIMDIPGVRAIKHLQITNYLDGVPMTPGELWCLKLNGAYSLNLSKESTKKIHFFRNGLMFFADREQAELIIRTLQAESSKPKLLNAQNDWPVPSGSYRHLHEYSSVQNDFPDIYKAGRNGVATTDTPERIANVKQLKAFLLFFDQLLVNFYGQLDLARDLLSMDKLVKVPATYASLPVYDKVAGSELPNFSHVQNLIRDFTDTLPPSTDLDNELSYKTLWEAFVGYDNNEFMTHLREIAEDRNTYYERRNLFLDHLIARFAENFGEYSRIFNDMAPPLSDQDLLANFTVIDQGGGTFDFEYYVSGVKVLENIPPSVSGLDNLKALVRRVIINGMSYDNYKIDPLSNFNYVLNDADGNPIARNTDAFPTQQAAEVVIFNTIDALTKLYYSDEESLVIDKQLFLDDYPRLSSERGKAFRYKCCSNGNTPHWPGENTSGLQRRVARLLGIDDPTDRMLLPVERDFQKGMVSGSIRKFRFRKLGANPVLLESKPPHFDNSAYFDVVFKVIEHAVNRTNYHPMPGQSFELRDKQGNVLAIPVVSFATDADRDKFISELVAYFQEEYFREGFHLIEHILLRPVQAGLVTVADVDEGYFGLCNLDEECDCPITDHYSFRITIALPYWPERFRNMSFRAYAERLIRYETPAHILPKICWIGFDDMLELEQRYLEWVTLECQDKPDRDALDLAITNLIKAINNMKNVYPDGVLHDCDNPTDDDAIVLNQSALGTLDDEAAET